MKRIRSAEYKEKQRLRFHQDPKHRKAVIERVNRLRKKRMAYFIELLGGCCRNCGYNRCSAALDFHHVERGQKKFQLSLCEMTRSMKDLMKESKKCWLLCANCHRELEFGNVSELVDETVC